MARIAGLRNGAEMVEGLVYFGRMLDKIRLHAKGQLPADYNRGSGFDARMARLFRLDYAAIEKRTLEGGTDEDVLEWCNKTGRKLEEDDIEYFNVYMLKRGLADEKTAALAKMKADRGWAGRDDIKTYFDFHRADEAE